MSIIWLMSAPLDGKVDQGADFHQLITHYWIPDNSSGSGMWQRHSLNLYWPNWTHKYGVSLPQIGNQLMTQKILPPEKIPSTSIIHPLQSSDLKHPSKGAFFFFLIFPYYHYTMIQLAFVDNTPLEREFILCCPWIHRQELKTWLIWGLYGGT